MSALKAFLVLIVLFLSANRPVYPVRVNVSVASAFVSSVTLVFPVRSLFAPLIVGTMEFARVESVVAIQDTAGVIVVLILPQRRLKMVNPRNFAL